MASLSLVIVALNEELTIGKVIEAAEKLADEIIVVDSGSTDRTIEIARALKANVQHQDWLGYAAQKTLPPVLPKAIGFSVWMPMK